MVVEVGRRVVDAVVDALQVRMGKEVGGVVVKSLSLRATLMVRTGDEAVEDGREQSRGD